MLIEIKQQEEEIRVPIPLTSHSGKIRIKQRNSWEGYGIPVATRKIKFAANCYVEWQIGFDILASEAKKQEKTTLPNHQFTSSTKEKKALYELSEYIHYLFSWNILTQTQIKSIADFLEKIPESDLFDSHKELNIKRSPFSQKEINKIPFSFSQVKYPILVHKFNESEILAEIITREKQRAIGVQPMLYLCFPITELSTSKPLLDRTAEKNESAHFIISKRNATVFLQLLQIFGMLSVNHRHDILQIIETILKK